MRGRLALLALLAPSIAIAQPAPDEPYPYPAQPYPAQPYPAQPYPAQPYSVPAQPRQVTPPPYQVADHTWYGWKIALSDGAAYAAFFLADSIEDPGTAENDGVDVGPALLALGALGWWTFATPLVHLTEGNFRGAGVSFALRWTAPLIGAVIGSAFDPEASPDDPGATAGLLAGVAIASIVDITVVANKRTVRTVWPQPQLAVSSSAVRVGLAGAF
jgi:hypothetical protein